MKEWDFCASSSQISWHIRWHVWDVRGAPTCIALMDSHTTSPGRRAAHFSFTWLWSALLRSNHPPSRSHSPQFPGNSHLSSDLRPGASSFSFSGSLDFSEFWISPSCRVNKTTWWLWEETCRWVWRGRTQGSSSSWILPGGARSYRSKLR